jgi:acyl carrier protein
MLTLDMELEAGLGIDSIKRVEILAALQHEVPALAGVGTAEMAALNTLGEIVAFAAGAVPAGPVLSAAAAAPVAAATAPYVDYHALLLQVVADKTGYPASILTLDMELEAGLGIDSIKRVEILAALQEKIPQLAGVDTGRLAALNTLGEILTFASPVPGAAPTMAAVTAVAAPIIPASAVDHQAVLLEVVADKTGYPASMLTLDMELEAGLGIDSIKRVEILAALQQKIPALADLDTGRLAALNTLGEILAFALDASGVASSPSGAAAVVGPAAPGLQRFEVRSAPARSSGLATPGLFAAAPLYLLGGAAIAAALAVRLEAAGIDVRVVDVLPADACSAVLLGALDADADDVAAQAAVNEAAFLALQPCADTMAAQGNLLVTVQDTGGDFGLGGAMGARAWSTGIAALAKTAALEWPHVSVKAIDIACDGRGSDAIAEALALELLAGGPQLEAGLLASGERVAPVLRGSQSTIPAPAILANDGVVVVSGGARGVTAECLAALAGRVPGVKLAILGRTPLRDEPAGLAACATDAELKGTLLARHKADGHTPTPTALGAEVRELLAQRELRANLARFEALGASVRYMAVDVVDAAAVRQVLDGIRTEFGPIRGLVHAAGVLADKEIRRKTLPQFQHVFSTKVDGLHNLLAATHDDALTHIVCFSSVAAWRGNVGQADYAMANEVLNRVCAAERARRGAACLVKSIGWGPWAGGMVGANLEQHFAAMGVALIPLADGARLFADEFTGQNGAATGIVFGGGLEQFTAAGPRRESAGFDVRFHRATHPLIAGHVIRGTPVVPLVMVNDLAVQAVQALCPVAKVGGSANLKVVKGMQLRHFDGTGDRYRIECRRGADPDVVAVKVVDAGGVLYYTLDVALGAADARPAPAAPANLREWRPSSGAIYDGRLFHGAGLQVIKKLDGIGPGGGVCTLAPDTSPQPGFAAPVDVLDGGLQLAVLWLHEQAGCESLPTGVGRILVHARPMHGATVQCEAVCESRTNLVAQFTIVYRNAGGEPLATLERVTMHLLPDALSAGASASVAIADVV